MNKVTVIAEAGVNHNGDINLAKKLIDVASSCGADFIKFQTFRTESLAIPKTLKANYQIMNTNDDDLNQNDMLKKLELSEEDHEVLIKYCKDKDINFLSTAFDIDSLDFLINKGIKIIKVPSGNLTDYPYLKFIASKKLPVILSTGMATMEEIKNSLNVLLSYGMNKNLIKILHCTTSYPADFKDINLNAMLSIKKEFDVDIGYSDHSIGIEVSIAAVAMGARVIEKHFTLNKDDIGPDHAASLEPEELKNMIGGIRNIQDALGDGEKKPTNIEIQNMEAARKSIVTKTEIKRGDVFSEENLTTKRPGTGISPMLWDKYIGKKSMKDYKKDTLLKE
mgnify:CR=1 FL=1